MSDAYTAKDVDRLLATIDYLRADNVRLLAELGEALRLIDYWRAEVRCLLDSAPLGPPETPTGDAVSESLSLTHHTFVVGRDALALLTRVGELETRLARIRAEHHIVTKSAYTFDGRREEWHECTCGRIDCETAALAAVPPETPQ